ncbi:protein far1-related sequence 5 [Phtheirospermum japonicum]|uniref:Protein FAR1-RELATED SEQUENCE n=1 Tax=Phtheirospermum japonicum TaxID=374723 RepID=A0A830C3L9_9LAMI|nr:protein far1-related sequence 5 [Phtheirospermum japonicum]
MSDPSRNSLPPLSLRNTKYDHSSHELPSGIRLTRDVKEDSGRFSSLLSSSSSPRVGFSRSSTRLSLQADFGDMEFSSPFIVDDVDPPDSQTSTNTHLKDIETHAGNLLTQNMFFMIREEIKKEAVTLSRIEHEVGSIRIYSVHEYSKPHLKSTMKFDKNSLSFECSCLQLETVGWPCAHMFAVMKAEHMKEIPSTCVLKRWTRNAKENGHNQRHSEIPTNVTQNARYGALISLCNKMCYYASFCDEGYGELCDIITQTTNKMNGTTRQRVPRQDQLVKVHQWTMALPGIIIAKNYEEVVKEQVGDNYYRHDLKKAALARLSVVNRDLKVTKSGVKKNR